MLTRGALQVLRDEQAEQQSDELEVWVTHEPTNKQAAFLALDCREALYGGAAGGGKSDALLMAALQHVHVPRYSAILFRRTYTDLALPGAIMDRSHEWLGGTAAHWQDRDKVWTFPSGATLAFGYMDGPRDHMRYKSAEFQFVGFDELTEFLERQYVYLFSRLRKSATMDVPLRMRAATNPGDIGHEWVKRRFLTEPGTRVFVPAKLEDNPHLDREAYGQMLDELDPVTRQQLRDGLWIQDSSGLVYHCWLDARNTAPFLPELPGEERWMRALGCDFGVTDPTAFVEVAFAEHDPRVFVTRSDQWPGLSPSEAAEHAIAWEAEIDGGYDAIIGDVGGLGKGFEAEWARRFAIPMRAAEKHNKLGYIKLLNGDLHHGRLLVLPGNEQLVDDLTALAWKDESHRAEHPGLPNHLPDALLYVWREARHWAWEERKTPPQTPAARAAREASERKERVKNRIKRKESGETDEWIFGPG